MPETKESPELRSLNLEEHPASTYKYEAILLQSRSIRALLQCCRIAEILWFILATALLAAVIAIGVLAAQQQLQIGGM